LEQPQLSRGRRTHSAEETALVIVADARATDRVAAASEIRGRRRRVEAPGGSIPFERLADKDNERVISLLEPAAGRRV